MNVSFNGNPLSVGLLAVTIAVSGVFLSASASTAYACDPPIVGQFDVSARQFLPIGPSWTFVVSETEEDRFNVEIRERNLRFSNLDLRGLELNGISDNGSARLTLQFEMPDGDISGNVFIRGEIPSFKFEGSPRSQPAFKARYDRFEDCAGHEFGDPDGTRKAATETGEVVSLRSQIELLQRENETMRESIANERISFRAEREVRTRELERVQTDLSDAQQQNVSLRRQLGAARNSADGALVAELADLEVENKGLKQQLMDTNAQLNSCRQERGSPDVIAQLEKKVESLEAQINRLRSPNSPERGVQAELDQLRSANTTLKNSNDQFSVQVGSLEKTVREQAEERDRLLTSDSNIRKAVESCEAELESLLSASEGR